MAAARLITAEGFGAVTLERVGLAAGYSRGLASHRFGSKDGLVRAAIAFVTDRVEARVIAAITSLPGPRAQLIGWTGAMLDALREDEFVRAYFVMMAAAVGNRSAVSGDFLLAHNAVRVRLRELVDLGRAAGEIRGDVDADAVALSIGSLQLGISVELLLDPAMDLAALAATARHAVEGMIGPVPAA